MLVESEGESKGKRERKVSLQTQKHQLNPFSQAPYQSCMTSQYPVTQKIPTRQRKFYI